MVEKTVITGLIAIFASVGYAEVADQSEEVLQETTVIAAVVQERQIETALEMYWLSNSEYPDVKDEEVVEVLHDENLLESDKLVYEVDYQVTKGGQDFTLEVS